MRAAHEPKLSQTKVARAAGMSLWRYWQIENGDLGPTTDEQAAVAAALGVKVSDIAWPEVHKAVAS